MSPASGRRRETQTTRPEAAGLAACPSCGAALDVGRPVCPSCHVELGGLAVPGALTADGRLTDEKRAEIARTRRQLRVSVGVLSAVFAILVVLLFVLAKGI